MDVMFDSLNPVLCAYVAVPLGFYDKIIPKIRADTLYLNGGAKNYTGVERR